MSWDPPWPPVQISECEWVIVRNHIGRPKALVRRFDATRDHPTFFRVVTWAPKSEDRRLWGYFPTLEEADHSVKFDVPDKVGPGKAPAQMFAQHAR